MSDAAAQAENTDRELWREREGDFYADSIFVTERGGIGIDCGGTVFVKPLREWHRLALAEQGAAAPARDDAPIPPIVARSVTRPRG